MKPSKSKRSSDIPTLSERIREEALRLGFDGCGFSRAVPLEADGERLQDWLTKGHHAGMGYMANHFDKRMDPTKLVDGARSVVSVILNYFPARRQLHSDAPVLSAYAYGKDYHKVIRKKLKRLLQFMQLTMGPVNGRGFVDSAPVLDRAWAARAGLGWIGRNSCLISPQIGSFFFIGTLIVDLALEEDRPIHDFCGDCNRCVRACPTSAITANRTIDSNHCLSYLTIEHHGEIDESYRKHFSNRVFGCDICQDVCPWNRKAPIHLVPEFEPVPGLLEMTRDEWMALDREKFDAVFNGSAVKRAKYEGLRRNLDFMTDSGV
jgi:epoxyqueuosine reductase